MAHKILCVTDLDGTFVKNSVDVNSVDWQAYQKLTRYSDFAIATVVLSRKSTTLRNVISFI